MPPALCGAAFGFGQLVQGGEAARFYSALDGSWVAAGHPFCGSEPYGREPAYCYDNVEGKEAREVEALSRRLLLLRDLLAVAVRASAHGFKRLEVSAAQLSCVCGERCHNNCERLAKAIYESCR